MKNLLLLVLVLVGAAFIAKVVIEKQHESKLDDFISLSRGFVDISYDDVKIDFDGSVAINGFSITPPGLDESLDVKSATVVSSDRLLPIKGTKIFENGKFPETFELNISQFSVPISLVEDSQKKYFDDLNSGEECRSLSTSFNYSSAGYSRLDSDIRMVFDFSDVYNAVVNIEIFDQTSSLTFEWVFDANEIEDLFLRRTSELPVSEISATYSLEPSAAENFVDQCASVFKVTPEVYLEKVVGSAKYSENSFGADLGPEMRQALVKFMKGGSEFSFYSKPSSQLKKWEQLQFYKAKDILRWLNMTLALDGEDLSLNAAIREAEENAEKAELEANQAKPQVNKYFQASATRARSHIGQWVKIKRNNQLKSLEGRLTGISEEGRLMVEMYRHGGLMTLTVGTGEIARFEVLSKR